MKPNIIYKRVDLRDIEIDSSKESEVLRNLAINRQEIKAAGLEPLVDRLNQGNLYYDGDKWRSHDGVLR